MLWELSIMLWFLMIVSMGIDNVWSMVLLNIGIGLMCG